MDSPRVPKVEYLAGDGKVQVPVRTWEAKDPSPSLNPVIVIHGLQSHSGWFTRSSAFLASSGVDVVALDRRGSGLSREPTGHCHDFQEMVNDIHTVFNHLRRTRGVSQVHLLGHCFGAIPALAYAATWPATIRSIILATPGLFTKVNLSLIEKLRILIAKFSRRQILVPIPLDATMFSELEEYVTFVKEDHLSLRSASGSFFWEYARARRFVLRSLPHFTFPLLVLCAGLDPISDNVKTRRFFELIPSQTKVLREYQTAKHILEFSRHQQDFFQDLLWWVHRIDLGPSHATHSL